MRSLPMSVVRVPERRSGERRRRERVVDERVAQVQAPESRLHVGRGGHEAADVESRHQPLVDVQLGHEERVGGAIARQPEDVAVLHVRGGKLQAEVEPPGPERGRRGDALVGKCGAEVLRQQAKLALGQVADVGQVRGRDGQRRGEQRGGEQSLHHHSLRDSGIGCSAKLLPALATWPGVSWPTMPGTRRAAAISRSRSTPVS